MNKALIALTLHLRVYPTLPAFGIPTMFCALGAAYKLYW